MGGVDVRVLEEIRQNIGALQVPEEAVDEPPILTPEEDAERAAMRAALDESSSHPHWPQPSYPLRQGGELSPDPSKRFVRR